MEENPHLMMTTREYSRGQKTADEVLQLSTMQQKSTKSERQQYLGPGILFIDENEKLVGATLHLYFLSLDLVILTKNHR